MTRARSWTAVASGARRSGCACTRIRAKAPANGQLFLPPLRPAAAFWALLPPLPLPLLFLLWLLPLLLPPLLDEPGEFEIAAARDLLMPFLRKPSYCLSFLTLDPWSFAIALPPMRLTAGSQPVPRGTGTRT